MKAIEDFEVIDHGYDAPDYFRGCGVASTRYDECVTGIGCDPMEAFLDALDQLGEMGYDPSVIEDEFLSHVEDLSADVQECDDSEMQYYLSVRFVRP